MSLGRVVAGLVGVVTAVSVALTLSLESATQGIEHVLVSLVFVVVPGLFMVRRGLGLSAQLGSSPDIDRQSPDRIQYSSWVVAFLVWLYGVALSLGAVPFPGKE
jgi:hypothetical protein